MAINPNKLMFRIGQINNQAQALINKICRYSNSLDNEKFKVFLLEISGDVELFQSEVSYELLEDIEEENEEECSIKTT